MLPSGRITEQTIAQLGDLMRKHDVIIDGGNTNFKDDVRRPRTGAKGVKYLDVGTWAAVGPGARLLPDDRRRCRGRGPSRPDLRRPGARARHDRAHAGRDKLDPAMPSAATSMPAGRRWPFRQDDP
jgi:hypothetical protein